MSRSASGIGDHGGWVRRRAWPFSACLCLLIACTAGHAERYALLIGVSEVAALPARLRLRGPDNDVALMRDTLIARGFAPEHVRVLARRAPSAHALPTYGAIRRALDDLAARAAPGDVVVLHLAGHGARVPQREGGAWIEPDGLDEVFLTEDTSPWDATRGLLPQALTDDEIGAWMDALVDRGATVWGIFDTCHAGGMSRSPSSSWARWRSVAAEELGVPTHLASRSAPLGSLAGRSSAAAAPSKTAPRTDRRVLAFAARGHELAGEEWLPRDAGAARARVHGVLSYAVAQALSGGADSSHALGNALRERYAREGRVAPTPQVVGEGNLTGARR